MRSLLYGTISQARIRDERAMTKNTEKPAIDHTGHRQRLKHQYLVGGLDSFDDARALELLLTYAIPRKDTHQIARQLLAEFGTFAHVLEARAEDLQRVQGMTAHAAILVGLVLDVSRRYLLDRASGGNIMHNLEECGEYLIPFFYGKRDEEVYMLALDAKARVINCQKIGDGSVNSANVPVRKIVAAALNVNAVTVILAHNHPSGIALPSQEDIDATALVRSALDTVGITLLDHLIIADSDFVSLKQSGYYPG